MADFAVIGLGHFGRAVARNLALQGQSVLALDRDRERLEAVRGEVETVMCINTTDEGAMASLRLDRMACAVVTMGPRATEASVLTTAILREKEVPRIVARAFDERHARILLAVGANEVLNPEADLARQLATRLVHPSIVAEIQLGEAIIAEVEVPESFVARTLEAMDLRERYGITVLALRREGVTRVHPETGEEMASGDVLVLMGPPEAIHDFTALR